MIKSYYHIRQEGGLLQAGAKDGADGCWLVASRQRARVAVWAKSGRRRGVPREGYGLKSRPKETMLVLTSVTADIARATRKE